MPTCVSMRLGARKTMVSKLFRYLSWKDIKAKSCFYNGYFDISWPPEPYLLQIDQLWRPPQRKISSKAIDCSLSLPPTYNSFWDNGAFQEKYDIPLNLTPDDLWWPRYWRDRNNFLGEYLQPIERCLPHLCIILGFRDRGRGWSHPPTPRRHGASCQEARHGAG